MPKNKDVASFLGILGGMIFVIASTAWVTRQHGCLEGLIVLGAELSFAGGFAWIIRYS